MVGEIFTVVGEFLPPLVGLIAHAVAVSAAAGVLLAALGGFLVGLGDVSTSTARKNQF